jgi:hypothetical protein
MKKRGIRVVTRKYLLKHYTPSSGLNNLFPGRGGVYLRPQARWNTATGGDKPYKR